MGRAVKSPKSDAVAVKVGRALYDQIKDYALLNGENIQQAANRFLKFGFEIMGETTMQHNFDKMATSIAQHAEEPCFVTPVQTYPCKHPS